MNENFRHLQKSSKSVCGRESLNKLTDMILTAAICIGTLTVVFFFLTMG